VRVNWRLNPLPRTSDSLKCYLDDLLIWVGENDPSCNWKSIPLRDFMNQSEENSRALILMRVGDGESSLEWCWLFGVAAGCRREFAIRGELSEDSIWIQQMPDQSTLGVIEVVVKENREKVFSLSAEPAAISRSPTRTFQASLYSSEISLEAAANWALDGIDTRISVISSKDGRDFILTTPHAHRP
jgi:hypothetical protein